MQFHGPIVPAGADRGALCPCHALPPRKCTELGRPYVASPANFRTSPGAAVAAPPELRRIPD
jgi:hypothetical protein